MSYDLRAKNPDVDDFHQGAFSYPVLLEACGHFFGSVHSGGQWYNPGGGYPGILSNDGFEVTAYEAGVMARIARNFVAVQRTLPDDHMAGGLSGKMEWKTEDVEVILMKAMSGRALNEKWPVKVRTDFVDTIERFAEWADRSGGFEIH